jgi:hypothetical protein
MADASLQDDNNPDNNPTIDLMFIPDYILETITLNHNLDSFSELQKNYINDRLKYSNHYKEKPLDFQLIPNNDLFDIIVDRDIHENSESIGPEKMNNHKATNPENKLYNIQDLPPQTLKAILNHYWAISSLNTAQRAYILFWLNLTYGYLKYNHEIVDQIKMFKPSNIVLDIIQHMEERMKRDNDFSAGGNKPKSRKVTPRYKRTTSKKYHKRHIY